MKKRCLWALAFVLLFTVNVHAQFVIMGMTTDYQPEPISVDSECPVFGWQMQTEEKDMRQIAWRIRVTDTKKHLVWDSGLVTDDKSVAIAYGGEPLQPCTRYEWSVDVTDNRGRICSATSYFETSMMSVAPNDLQWRGAQWIGGDEHAMPFSSQRLPVFRISYIQHGEGTFYYGGNDHRLMMPHMNTLGMATERDSSCIAVRISGGRLEVSRRGYGKPLTKTFSVPEAKTYHVEIASVNGTTTITLNGTALESIELNPVGRGGDYTSFPMVGDLGFAGTNGSACHFTNICVKNYRQPCHELATIPDVDTPKDGRLLFIKPQERGITTLSRTIHLRAELRQARLYATALGAYDFYVDSYNCHVGCEYLSPGMTQYNKTLLYQTYDITPLLQGKKQATLSADLYEGWWSGGLTYAADNWNYFGDRQALKALLVLTYTDGSQEFVATDHQWQWHENPMIRYASLFMGQIIDMTAKGKPLMHQAEVVDIDDVLTCDSIEGWPPAKNISHMQLIAQQDRGVRAFDTLRAQSVREIRPGVFVYDMGQNLAGTARIRMKGLKRGQRVTIRYAEMLYPNLPAYTGLTGMVMTENLRMAMAEDEFVSDGSDYVFEPRGTFHGYRYIEISGIDHSLPLTDVEGIVLSCIDGFTASIETSDTLLNRFVENVRWSTLANTISIPSDCPQRNERLGWSGDLSVFAPTMSYLFNADGFLRRHLRALRDTQHPDGTFADVAPVGGGFGGPLWQSVGVVVPWQLMVQYGDTTAVRRHFPAMQQYIDMVMRDYISPSSHHFCGRHSWADLGDWLGLQNDSNDNTMLFDCYLAYELHLMEQMARAIGLNVEARSYARLANERKTFIATHYFNERGQTTGGGFGDNYSSWTGRVGAWPRDHIIGTQTSYAVPLTLDIVPNELRDSVAMRLVETVAGGNEHLGTPPFSLLTGFVGTPWIAFALSDSGNADMAYRLLASRHYPSWLYSVTQGATTIWERMNSFTHEEGFGNNNSMNSFNHYAFGSVVGWLIQRAAGISRDEQSLAFKHFILQPQLDPTAWLTYMKAHYDSPYGRIESSWQKNGDGTVSFRFVVPANTSATLLLPGKAPQEIQSGTHTFVLFLH